MLSREGRKFQWWLLRWYWPERRAAGKPYKMRLLYTYRTVMRLMEHSESLSRIIDRQTRRESGALDQLARLLRADDRIDDEALIAAVYDIVGLTGRITDPEGNG